MSIFSLVILFSCGKDLPDNYSIENGYEYFPLEVGKYWIYQVDSIVYDPISGGTLNDTSITFMKEEIVEKFQNESGEDVYKLERLERKELSDPWTISKVVSLERNEKFAYRTEDNLRLISMVFPVQSRNDWVATQHFDPTTIVTVAGESMQLYKDWDSEVEEVGVMEEIGNFNFEITSVLHENSEDNPFERRFVFEKYAKNVGLVSKEMMILDSQYCNQEPVPDDCETLPWEEKGEKGFILKQIILEHN